MSIQQYGQTGTSPAVTQEQRAAWVQLKNDRDQLGEQVGVLKRGHQDLQRFLLKARRNNWIACTVVSLCTVAAWFLDASVWLRWYVLPITLFCCALVWFGGKFLDRLMHSKIARLSQFLEQTDERIEKGRPIFETDPPQTNQP